MLTFTPEMTYHIPVLLKETVEGMNLHDGGIYVDVTFGGGGHSREILRLMGTASHLYGFDQDEDAESNVPKDERFTFVRSNFRYLRNFMRYYGVEQVDAVIADLGVSSHHFDDAARGFSFRFDGRLDMRMNKRSSLTAADLVNNLSEAQLAQIFKLYGELRDSRRLASLIVKARDRKKIETIGDFLSVINPLFPSIPTSSRSTTAVLESYTSCRDGACPHPTTAAPNRTHLVGAGRVPARQELAKVFQALRIEVNHEMEALQEMLQAATTLIKPGGRLVVITYHSLEDRMVKNIMRAGNIEGKIESDFYGNTNSPFRLVNRLTKPSDEEQQRNPRSRSAKLRVAERN